MTLPLLPLAAAALLAAAPAPRDAAPGPFDWPQWRGPNQDAISKETGLLAKWPEKGPPLVWTAKGLGAGHGTPSVAAGHIFGMGTRDKKDGMWALKEADGSEVWFTPLEDPKDGNQNNGPGSTPTYHAGKLYGVTNKGTLACLDAATGKVEWTKNYLKDFGSKVPAWGFNDSVLIDGDMLICAPSVPKAAVVALKPATGEVIWKAEVPKPGGGFGYSTPVKATIHGVPTYVVLLGGDKEHTAGGVVGIEAKTGKLLWQYEKVGNGTAAIPTPIVDGDKVWASSSYGEGGSALVQIVKDGAKFTAKELKYYAKKGGGINNHHGGMVKVGDLVYFGHDQNQGQPVCVEFATGAIKWGPDKALAGGSGSSAYLYADGLFYIRYQNHVTVLAKAEPEGLTVVSSFKPPEPTKNAAWAHPVIANGKLYVRDQDRLFCFNVKGGTN